MDSSRLEPQILYFWAFYAAVSYVIFRDSYPWRTTEQRWRVQCGSRWHTSLVFSLPVFFHCSNSNSFMSCTKFMQCFVPSSDTAFVHLFFMPLFLCFCIQLEATVTVCWEVEESCQCAPPLQHTTWYKIIFSVWILCMFIGNLVRTLPWYSIGRLCCNLEFPSITCKTEKSYVWFWQNAKYHEFL